MYWAGLLVEGQKVEVFANGRSWSGTVTQVSYANFQIREDHTPDEVVVFNNDLVVAVSIAKPKS